MADEPQVPEVVTEPQLPAVVEEAGTPAALLQMAVAKDLDLEKLERLMALQERWNADQARKAFYHAMTEFQGMMSTLEKDAEVKYTGKGGQVTHYKHSSLGAIADEIRGPCQACGLSYRFEYAPAAQQGYTTVSCVVTHIAGHSERTSLDVPGDMSGGKNAIQALGSSLTYAHRYTVLPAFGLVTGIEDTDGRRNRNGPPQPAVPDDWPAEAEPPDATFAKMRGGFSGWMKKILQEEDCGKEGTKRTFTAYGQPDHVRFVTYSKLARYKRDTEKNAGPDRPFTCNLADSKTGGGRIYLLCEHLRHPAASDALNMPGFDWQTPPAELQAKLEAAASPAAPSPPPASPQGAAAPPPAPSPPLPADKRLPREVPTADQVDKTEWWRSQVRTYLPRVRKAYGGETAETMQKEFFGDVNGWRQSEDRGKLRALADALRAMLPPEDGDGEEGE
jgi:hypothetical protein